MPQSVVCYPDGSAAAVGDIVSLGDDEARVEEVVTPDNPTAFELPWPGLMLSWAYGRVFIPESDFVREGIALRCRAARLADGSETR